MKNYIYLLFFVLISLGAHATEVHKTLVPSPTDTTVYWDSVENMAYVNIVPVPWVRFEHNADRLYMKLLDDNFFSQAIILWQVRCTDTIDAVTFKHKVLQTGVYNVAGSEYSDWTGDIPYIFNFMANRDFINVTID